MSLLRFQPHAGLLNLSHNFYTLSVIGVSTAPTGDAVTQVTAHQ